MSSRIWTRRLKPDEDSIEAQVTITGPLGRRRPILLTVDTGTPVTILNVDVANLIDLTADRMTGPSKLIGPLGPEIGYRIPATSITLMGRTLRNLEIRCHVMAEDLTVDGVVGMDVLLLGRFVLDGPARLAEFTWP